MSSKPLLKNQIVQNESCDITCFFVCYLCSLRRFSSVWT